MAFFQSLGIVAFYNNISSSLPRKGVMTSPPNFRIAQGTAYFNLCFKKCHYFRIVIFDKLIDKEIRVTTDDK